jgi:hypothetical protein
MKLLVLSLLPVLMFGAGQTKAPRKAAKSTPPAKQAVVKPEIPAGATQTGPNSWRYTNEKGESWMYRKTPFGITRTAEAPKSGTVAKADVELPPGLKAAQVGESVQFERPGPFGVTRWSRKVGEMNEIERKIWERDCPQPGTAADTKSTGKE